MSKANKRPGRYALMASFWIPSRRFYRLTQRPIVPIGSIDAGLAAAPTGKIRLETQWRRREDRIAGVVLPAPDAASASGSSPRMSCSRADMIAGAVSDIRGGTRSRSTRVSSRVTSRPASGTCASTAITADIQPPHIRPSRPGRSPSGRSAVLPATSRQFLACPRLVGASELPTSGQTAPVPAASGGPDFPPQAAPLQMTRAA